MPRPRKRAARAKLCYSRSEIFHLAMGFRLTANRFGRGPESVELMREAWESDADLREQVQALFLERQARGRVGDKTQPWAATKFSDIPGDGRRAEPRPRSRQSATKAGRRAVRNVGDETNENLTKRT